MPSMVTPIPLNPEQIKAVQDWARDDRLWASRGDTEFNLYTFARVILKHADGVSRIDASVEDIQRRCRATAERFEALAGPAKVDAPVSADLLLEAASLLRGYHQSLLLTELQRRHGVGVFDPRLMAEDDDCREAQDNTPSLGPFKS